MTLPEEPVVVGKITTVHGVGGWVKIHSYTAPEKNIFDYQPWWLELHSGWIKLEIDDSRHVSKGFIAHINGVDDRDEAKKYCQRDIVVSAAVFPDLGDEEIYWHQLQGFNVITHFGDDEHRLGMIDGFLETGANDVMVIKPDEESMDDVERLIPFVDNFVQSVDQQNRIVHVDWDPAFETSKE